MRILVGVYFGPCSELRLTGTAAYVYGAYLLLRLECPSYREGAIISEFPGNVRLSTVVACTIRKSHKINSQVVGNVQYAFINDRSTVTLCRSGRAHSVTQHT